MHFQCHHCHAIVEIDDSDAGQAVACGECGGVVVVPATRFAPGSVIGDFLIQKEVGHGGMGVVYLSRQLSLDRACALKILNERFSADSSYVTDFIREARAAAQLNHPGIVQAYAVGEDEGVYYFGMEFVQGTTMKEMLTLSGRLPPDRALDMIAQVNTALEFAWQQQKLVHRDIKPDNIMLTESGQVKLADLGLARPASDLMDQGTEDIMGTPQYISPEALLQKPMDNRSDIYSLGATFYHAVTGRFPYLADNAVEFAQKHLTEKLLPPNKLLPDIPEPISRLIELMMAKRAEHRYPNSTELAKDIALVKEGKMPSRLLVPDAQRPIPVEGLSVKRKFAVGAEVNKHKKGPAVKLSTKKRLPFKVMAAIFAVVIGVPLIALLVMSVMAWREKRKSPEQKTMEAIQALMTTREQRAGFEATARAFIAKKTGPEILAATQQFLKTHGATLPPKALEELNLQTWPLTEAELVPLRAQRHAEQVKVWKKASDAKALAEAAAAAAAAAEAQKLQKAEAEKARLAEQERLKQERQAGLANRRAGLREQAMDDALNNQFGEAVLKFRKYGNDAREFPELARWATLKTREYELAEKWLELLVKQEAAVKAKRYKLTENGYPGTWTVRLLTRSKVELATEKLDSKGNRTSVAIELPLCDLAGGTLVEMTEAAAAADPAAGDTKLLAAAYILACGNHTALGAAQNLLLGSEDELARFLRDELPETEASMKQKEFTRKLLALKAKAREGDRLTVTRLNWELKTKFADLFEPVAQEVADLLKSM